MTPAGGLPRVLLVGGAMEGGGAEVRFSLLAQHIFAGTAEAAVFTSPREGVVSKVHSLGWAHKYSYPHVVLRLRQIIRRGAFDAVVGFSLYPTAVARLAMFGLSPRPAFVGMEVTRPLAVRSEWRGSWRAPLMDIAHRFSFSAADGFAANSIDGLEENITHYGVPRTRSARVHNILLQSDLKARAASVVLDVPASPSDTFRVCTAGRLDEMKLIDTVIAALSQFPANIPWQLWILGRGPAEQELRSQAARLRVADRVRFLGWRENPHAFVARSDVFVQPSRFEGYSNALVEAMAIGVPAITSFHSSDARLIVKEGAALGFEPGNVKGLFDALMEFRSNPGLAETMRAAAQRHIEPMALERVIPEYEKVVCAALAHARK